MKYLIISDAHFDEDGMNEIYNYVQADISINLGDSELDDNNVTLQRYINVKGNNDYFNDLPRYLDVEFDNFKFLLTHGHYEAVYFNRNKLSYLMEEYGAQICLYGHSHNPQVEILHDFSQLLINPGSISRPRMYKWPSYCIMHIDDNLITINYFNATTHEPLTELDHILVYENNKFIKQ